jgi:uncharacterized protein (TIGR02594 family)
MKTAPWLDIALREAGVKTFVTGTSNPRVEEYHRSVSAAVWNDKIPWCSSFLYWCMQQADIPGSRSALARSWLDWGVPLSEPTCGCIVVLWREQPDSRKGHVGLFLKQDSTHIHLWGGNQLNEVREHSYPRNMVLGFRWPASINAPQLSALP